MQTIKAGVETVFGWAEEASCSGGGHISNGENMARRHLRPIRRLQIARGKTEAVENADGTVTISVTMPLKRRIRRGEEKK